MKASSTPSPRAALRISPLHRTGLGLFAALAGWILLSGLVNGRSPWSTVAVLLLAAGSWALGYSTRTHVGRLTAPLAVVALGVVVLVLAMPHPVLSLSSGAFLGYSNANGSFFVIASFAALMAVAANRSPRRGSRSTRPQTLAFALTLGLISCIALFLVVPVLSHARGAMLSSVLFVPAVWIVAARRGHRVALAAVSVVLVTCVVLSFLVARHYTTEVVAKRDMRTASGLFGRANLWADGYRMFSGNSLIGVGPGGFQEKSFFGSDPDGRWVHNEFLQTAAETGFVGLCLLMALIGWSIFALARRPTDVSTVAALGIAAFALGATVDRLFHLPILPAIVSLLAGRASPGITSRAPVRRG